jgi:hypothetical protein
MIKIDFCWSRRVLGGFLRCAALLASLAVIVPVAAQAQFNVTTYHYDNFRTGWNNAETALTATSVASSQFNLLHSIPLDEQVDAQPLVLTGQAIGNPSTKLNVVYVATENDTIYAIDASSGAVLLTKNFGTPVPKSSLPGQCNNNSGNIGINSTPVIDPASNMMYVMTYTLENGEPVFRLHELDPSTLNDVVPSQVVSASATLPANGSTYTFDALVSRQRSALLVTNGTVYAGFASFCDLDSNASRGWLLGWKTGSLAPLSSNHLNNLLVSSRDSFFLSSIWMSGYGLATEGSGDIYFVTGNSDYDGTSYNTAHNLSESVVRVSGDLSTVHGFFTPSNVSSLDQRDTDFGSGGLMNLPPQPGGNPYLAVAAGKDGNMYLISRLQLHSGTNTALGAYQIGNCWCGPSYFTGSDNIGRVVSSGGDQIKVWRVQSSPSTALVQDFASPALPATVQDGGSFTTISSNGVQANTAVIWTVRRPTNNTNNDVMLYAFNGGTGAILASDIAGTWPNLTGNANIVPVVADGMVFVASYKQLDIFGIGTPGAAAVAHAAPLARAVTIPITLPPNSNRRLVGTIIGINGQVFTLVLRNKKVVFVLSTPALNLHLATVIYVGRNVELRGSYDSTGVFDATVILRAKRSPLAWPADR